MLARRVDSTVWTCWIAKRHLFLAWSKTISAPFRFVCANITKCPPGRCRWKYTMTLTGVPGVDSSIVTSLYFREKLSISICQAVELVLLKKKQKAPGYLRWSRWNDFRKISREKRKTISKLSVKMSVVKINALLEVLIRSRHNFIASIFYIMNWYLVVGVWCLRGREVVRAQERHPSAL